MPSSVLRLAAGDGLKAPELATRHSLAIPVGDAIWFCTHSFFFLSFFPPRFCPHHISGTVTRRDSELSVLLGSAV